MMSWSLGGFLCERAQNDLMMFGMLPYCVIIKKIKNETFEVMNNVRIKQECERRNRKRLE